MRLPLFPHAGSLQNVDLLHALTLRTPRRIAPRSLDRVNSARNFTNKLWNAGKFVLFNLEKVRRRGAGRHRVRCICVASGWRLRTRLALGLPPGSLNISTP